jgi:3-deoxy-manno-octulosonate cytidylyltransferase (CMP-KDO synthetase)
VNIAIIIPARLGSSRLPEKLLLPLGGKPIIQRTYEQAAKSNRAGRVLVATDCDEIASLVRGFGGEAIMTRPDHESGSERVAEAAQAIDADIIVNVQGDEPEIDPASIDALIETQSLCGCFASTLGCRFPAGADPADPSAVKVIFGRSLGAAPQSFEALYFTRALAPFPRDGGGEHHLHIGVYAFSRAGLMRFAQTSPSRLEKIEKLEQLRILEMGEKIAVRIVDASQPGIDTQSDYERAMARFQAEE